MSSNDRPPYNQFRITLTAMRLHVTSSAVLGVGTDISAYDNN